MHGPEQVVGIVERTSADNGIDRRSLGQGAHERILTDSKFSRAAVTFRGTVYQALGPR